MCSVYVSSGGECVGVSMVLMNLRSRWCHGFWYEALSLGVGHTHTYSNECIYFFLLLMRHFVSARHYTTKNRIYYLQQSCPNTAKKKILTVAYHFKTHPVLFLQSFSEKLVFLSIMGGFKLMIGGILARSLHRRHFLLECHFRLESSILNMVIMVPKVIMQIVQ